MSKIEVVDDVSLMREIVQDAVWNIAYHEHALTKAHKHVAVAHALMQRCGLDMTDRQATELYDEYTEEEDCATAKDLATHVLGYALWGVDHHEGELRLAHAKLAAAKMLMRRADIDVPIAEIEQKMREKAAE